MDRHIVMRRTGLTLPPQRKPQNMLDLILQLNARAGLAPNAPSTMDPREWMARVFNTLRAA